MAAKLTLDWDELLWYCQGFMCGSHLRWSGYERMVNDVWPQLSEGEREKIYTYAKRDLNHWEGKSEEEITDKTPYEYYHQMLARYNPTNQYKVSLENEKEKKVVEAYMWNGRYYIGWYSYCAPEYIKKVEHLPYRKCRNVGCAMREKCLRFTDYQVGDKVMEGREVWGCEKCDLIIEKDNKEFYK